MHIEFSNEQYRDLVMLVCLGDWVRGDVADQRGEDSGRWEKIKERILFAAVNENIAGIADYFTAPLCRAILFHTSMKRYWMNIMTSNFGMNYLCV